MSGALHVRAVLDEVGADRLRADALSDLADEAPGNDQGQVEE
jgi:hypothetical protein